MPLSHHDLCFGCGIANVFGLHLELERDGPEAVRGRFFVKQDHQGPPGFAHGGVLGSALDEAMALLIHDAGPPALTRRLEIDLLAPVPIGTYVDVRAWVESREGRRLWLGADARGEEGPLATGRALFVAVDPG